MALLHRTHRPTAPAPPVSPTSPAVATSPAPPAPAARPAHRDTRAHPASHTRARARSAGDPTRIVRARVGTSTSTGGEAGAGAGARPRPDPSVGPAPSAGAGAALPPSVARVAARTRLSAELLAAILEVDQRTRATLDDMERADALAERLLVRRGDRLRATAWHHGADRPAA